MPGVNARIKAQLSRALLRNIHPAAPAEGPLQAHPSQKLLSQHSTFEPGAEQNPPPPHLGLFVPLKDLNF